MYTLFGDTVPDPVLGEEVNQKKIASTQRPQYGGPMTERDKQLFQFTDTLFASDKKAAWLMYQKLLSEGYSVEGDIHTKVWWVLKSIQAVRYGNTADIKPLTLKKAEVANSKWSGEILNIRTIEFLESIVETRTIGTPSQYTMERWILTLP
jgi:hypothetical protein